MKITIENEHKHLSTTCNDDENWENLITEFTTLLRGWGFVIDYEGLEFVIDYEGLEND